MTESTARWFAPAPSELTSSRLSLDFGVRSADLAFRELVVPGLGRVWFVRQLSWPAAALALRDDFLKSGRRAPRPSAICHGIEALACKLEFRSNPDSNRILGKRAFGRDELDEVWDFERLHRRAYYVLNTHRQASTRTLRVDLGLGLAVGPRFDLLELEPVGRELADAFLGQRIGRGGGSLRRWLRDWVAGDEEVSRSSPSVAEALSPARPTVKERELIRARVLETVGEAAEKRRRLAAAVGRAAEPPDIDDRVVSRLRDAGHAQQASEIVAARAFGVLLDRARDVAGAMTMIVEPARGGVDAGVLARELEVARGLASLRAAAKQAAAAAGAANVNFPSSRRFVDEILGSDEQGLVRLLVNRTNGLLTLADTAVCRGRLFRVVGDAVGNVDDVDDDDAADVEPDGTGRTFRILNLHTLVRDFDTRGEA